MEDKLNGSEVDQNIRESLLLHSGIENLSLRLCSKTISPLSSVTRLCPTLSPPCSSPAAGLYSNSCSLSWWWHPTISFSIIPFCLQSFPASGSFLMNQFFTSDGQRTGASASASVLPMNIQDWFPLAWTGRISLQFKGEKTLKSLLQHHCSKAYILRCSAFFIVKLSHSYMTTGKIIALTCWTFVGKVMSLLFNMLSRLVTAFLPKSKMSMVFTVKPYARCWEIWKKCMFMF